MTAIYIPKPRLNVKSSSPAFDLTNYMKRDGTSIPMTDISWGNKKLLDLAICTEDHFAVNLGYVDDKTEKIENDVNAVSVKSEYLNYSGIFLIPNPILLTYT